MYPNSSFAKALQTHCGSPGNPLAVWMLCSIALLLPPLQALFRIYLKDLGRSACVCRQGSKGILVS